MIRAHRCTQGLRRLLWLPWSCTLPRCDGTQHLRQLPSAAQRGEFGTSWHHLRNSCPKQNETRLQDAPRGNMWKHVETTRLYTVLYLLGECCQYVIWKCVWHFFHLEVTTLCVSPVAPWLRDFCCSAGTPKRLSQEPGKADVKWSENYPNDINDQWHPMSHGCFFQLMEPHGTTAQISSSSTDKYSKHPQVHGMLSVFCLGLDSHKASKKSCYSNRQFFTGW